MRQVQFERVEGEAYFLPPGVEIWEAKEYLDSDECSGCFLEQNDPEWSQRPDAQVLVKVGRDIVVREVWASGGLLTISFSSPASVFEVRREYSSVGHPDDAGGWPWIEFTLTAR